MNKGWLAALAFPAVAGLVWLALKSNPSAPASPRAKPSSAPSAAAATAPVRPPSYERTSRKTPASVPSEIPSSAATVELPQSDPVAMKALQDLLEKDKEAALAEARAGLARDPKGPDAAARTWVVVKALAGLGRLDEARREAEVMVPKYRGTWWANDVERHVLAHP